MLPPDPRCRPCHDAPSAAITSVAISLTPSLPHSLLKSRATPRSSAALLAAEMAAVIGLTPLVCLLWSTGLWRQARVQDMTQSTSQDFSRFEQECARTQHSRGSCRAAFARVRHLLLYCTLWPTPVELWLRGVLPLSHCAQPRTLRPAETCCSRLQHACSVYAHRTMSSLTSRCAPYQPRRCGRARPQGSG
jgi:hypothetical protein